jgi:hypothetical protein
VLSTGVQAPATHWKQCVLWFNAENRLTAGGSDEIIGTIRFARLATNARDYSIEVSWRELGSSCNTSSDSDMKKQSYALVA